MCENVSEHNSRQGSPLVSAVIPTYRRENLLREAVLSVLAQESDDVSVEVVVVNDAGGRLARADWQADPRVQVVSTHRTERSVARNTGAALASGEYLHFLDDDDVALPGAYAALLEPVRAWPEIVLSCGAYETIEEETGSTQRVEPITDGRLFAALVAGIGIPLGACLIRRLTFWSAGGFDVSFTVMEDLELLQRLVLQGKWAGTATPTARFRVGRHSLSTTNWRASSDACRRQREKAFEMRVCYRKLRDSLRHPDSAGLRGRLARFYLGSAVRHARACAFATAAGRSAAGLGLGLLGVVWPGFWRGFTSRGNTPELLTRKSRNHERRMT